MGRVPSAYRIVGWMIVLSAIVPDASADPLSLILPTSNDALLTGDYPEFYQYTDRYFEGVRSRPWEGGQYGYVRNPRHTSAGLVYTRFHEGVDIRAVYRDWRDEPLDTVRAIDDGYIVYVNKNERHSSYGIYVVVEHWWSGSPFYSLYAHLNSVDVQPGMRVRQGDRLGRLGYTGRGIDRRRAHLHFEINMLLNRNFQQWYDRNYRSMNRHDVFNGINLAGIDVADLYLSLQADSELTIEQYLTKQRPFYAISVPLENVPDLIDRYQWLLDWSQLRASGEEHRSWEIEFLETGVPVRIRPSAREVDGPVLIGVHSGHVAYAGLTNGRVGGQGSRSYLSRSGRQYAELLVTSGDREDVVEFDRPQVRPVFDAEGRLRIW